MPENEQNQETTDYNHFNRKLIAEYRANGGKVSGMFAGAPLLLLTTTGAKSGQPRVAPLAYTTDNDRLVVIASKGGAPTHPDWFHNVRANPDVVVQVGRERVPMTARVADDEERAVLWPKLVALYPDYDSYQSWTERVIPVVVLEPLR